MHIYIYIYMLCEHTTYTSQVPPFQPRRRRASSRRAGRGSAAFWRGGRSRWPPSRRRPASGTGLLKATCRKRAMHEIKEAPRLLCSAISAQQLLLERHRFSCPGGRKMYLFCFCFLFFIVSYMFFAANRCGN